MSGRRNKWSLRPLGSAEGGNSFAGSNPVPSAQPILTDISHLVSCLGPAWTLFVIFFQLHRFASPFSSPPSVFLWHRGALRCDLSFSHAFRPDAKTPFPWFPLFSCESFHFLLHPDAAAGNLSRPIPSRIARNNSLGTATSAIWKTIFREWRTTFAPILINFSRNVVSVQ